MTAMRLKRYPSPSGGLALGKMGVGATMLNGWKNPYVTDGLVAMWDGEWNAGPGKHDASATTWVDLSENGNNATRVGSAAFGTNYATFDGASYYVSSSGLDFTTALTWEVCGNQAASNYDRDYLAWNIGSSEKRGVDLYNARSVSLLRLKYGKDTAGVAFIGWQYPPISLDDPCTIAFTLGSAIGLHYNGEQKTTSSLLTLYPPEYKRMVIGANLTNTNGRASSQMYGQIHSVRLYNRALTASEIAANYAIDKERFNLP